MYQGNVLLFLLYASSSQFGLHFYQIISSIKNPNLLLIKPSELKYETILTVFSMKRYRRLVVDITNFAPWAISLANRCMIHSFGANIVIFRLAKDTSTRMQLDAITFCLNVNHHHNNQEIC